MNKAPDNAQVIAELNRAKCAFQLRGICAAMGIIDTHSDAITLQAIEPFLPEVELSNHESQHSHVSQ